MLTPLRPCSLQFVSDGTSTQLAIDLTVQPLQLNFSGSNPAEILLLPTLTNSQGVNNPAVQATLVGTVVVFQFQTPPIKYDMSHNPVFYTLSFQLSVPPAAMPVQTGGYGFGGYGVGPYGE